MVVDVPPKTRGMLYEGSGITVVTGVAFFLPPNCIMASGLSVSRATI